MGNFKDAERVRQAAYKRASTEFSEAARGDGWFMGAPRAFCLPEERAVENLWAGIRADALDVFAANDIAWHGRAERAGKVIRPLTNHLCGSQVCCVNFLFPFARHPHALAALLRPVYPGLTRMVEMERAGQFVSFEWIGLANYLGEKVGGSGRRTRGQHFTSADACVMFDCADGTRQIALIEWKYTEAYSPTDLRVADSGTDRTAIYAPLFERDDFPLRKELLPSFGALFYEPFYQLLRQQMLAREMERAHELDADRVSLLHLAPAANRDFQRVTSPHLAHLGATVMDVWRCLVREGDRFASASVEDLFGRFPVSDWPELRVWWEYISARYGWPRP